MNTHEYYVSLETAKMLKEAGFDWEVKFFYRDGILRSVLPDELFNGDFEDIEYYYKHIGIPHQSLNYNNGSSKFLEEYSAPTLDVAQRWLREVKGIETYAHVFYDSRDMLDEWDVYVYEVNHITKHTEDYILSYDIYHTYEEAFEAGIKKVLELILERGE